MKLGFVEEWSQLKRFEKLSDQERSIVFYAENKALMNHFKKLIYIIRNTFFIITKNYTNCSKQFYVIFFTKCY